MISFKIENGDLVLDDGNDFKMVEGLDEIAQCVENTLYTNTGEWFLNILHGLRYDGIQGKGKNKSEISLAIIEAVLQEERVQEVVSVDINFDDIKRSMSVNLCLRTVKGVLELKEVENIG